MNSKFFASLAASIAVAAAAPAYAQSETTSPQTVGTNPDVSLNLLVMGRAGNRGQARGAEAANGFHFQEAELRFTSNIDTYFRGDATFAFHREDGEFHIEPEEAFLETLAVPAVTFRVGKFYADIGRHNALHTHSFPFIDAPLVHQSVLGEEGLNEIGVSASYLVPTPWFMELVAQGFSAENENLFGSDNANDIAGVLTLKSLWDLSDSSTLELDWSYGAGKNSFDGNTQLVDLAMTFKWRPIENSRKTSVAWTTEFLHANRGEAPGSDRIGGVATWVQYQFAQRWWAQGRGEMLGIPAPEEKTRRYSALLGYVPTEYSALRLQYDAISEGTGNPLEHRVSLQFNVSMGAHPAHTY